MELSDYVPILVYFAVGVVVSGALFALGKLMLTRRRPNPDKYLPYESGILPTGSVHQRFSIDFYLTAMLFIIFDIELAFLYPLAVVLRDEGLIALIVLLVFVFTVVEALVYVWKKGALEWR
ncbi:MAG TPA: NADH-quinone oxidoreductase subunit A [Miltoncostaeaceae bacterium]|nr:NADH-quinone oxidoreductase subunit A [Miltoncostaeaceae bacterium]